jgi:CubicO group peptidase (beta-lactamase class C family)
MARGIEDRCFPGGVVLVRIAGEVVVHRAYGQAVRHQDRTTLSPHPIDARPDTVYDLASLTKLVTATCAMQLVDEGKLRLDEPVAARLPAFAAHDKGRVTVRHLLTHTGGLPPFEDLWRLELTPDARLRRALAARQTAPAGSSYVYSDLGLIALGRLIEEITGASLDRVVAERVAGPLGLKHTQHRPPAALRPAIAATEYGAGPRRGLIWGEVHDENAWSLGGVAGHAGLFGTADDVAVFGQLFLNGGTYDGSRLLRPETAAEMVRNQIGGLGNRGLGWDLDAPSYMGRLASPQTYGHTGFTGTSLVVDPRRALIVVLLTNRVHPTREGPSLGPIRQAVADAALAAIGAT